MYRTTLVAGLVACFALAACDQPAEAPPPAKKSLARQAQFYAGQEQLASLQTGTVEAATGGGVVMKATGMTSSAGWTDAGFVPRIYAATPPDGVYEIDVVAQKPAAEGATVMTPVEVRGEWSKYTDGRVKGVKMISKTNEIVAMLPRK
jgi:hypothetical protein